MLFSTQEFVDAWISGSGSSTRRIEISVTSPLGRSSMSGIGKDCGFGQRSAEFGPDGLYACPSPHWAATDDQINRLLGRFRHQRIVFATWHLRYDQTGLADKLTQRGLKKLISWPHVLALDKPYPEIFSSYNATRRNEIRKAHRRGISIRQGGSPKDVHDYCAVHVKLAAQKPGFKIKYSVDLIHGLVKLRNHVTLLLAEREGNVIAGALLLLDGDSMFYWHGAADRDYREYFATCALLNRAVETACEMGCKTFNFGASGTETLRNFKESFGAVPKEACSFALSFQSPLFVRFLRKVWRLYGG